MLEIMQLGCIPYKTAWDWQGELVEARSRNAAPDRLLLLEHPPTYTLGASGHEENLLLTPEECQRQGIEVFHVDRGGDITFHGPGQLVGYPIIMLERPQNGGLRNNVVGYVRNLEAVIIRTLADFGIEGQAIPGLTGVWVETASGPEKVCAIGVKINVRGVTKHGFALNINTDLRYFEGIVPCGIDDKAVTSMERLLGHPLDEAEVTACLIDHFAEVFAVEIMPAEPPFALT